MASGWGKEGLKYLGGGARPPGSYCAICAPGADSFGPDNVLVFMASVIKGLSLIGTTATRPLSASVLAWLTAGSAADRPGAWSCGAIRRFGCRSPFGRTGRTAPGS
jgi:hypothetical protein